MRKQLGFGVVAGLALFAGGLLLGMRLEQGTAAQTGESAKDYPLLAQRLFVDNPNDTQINFSDLRTELNKYFSDRQLEGTVYFEYLPTGTSVRVNPDARYHAASLIKLPVAMELFKAKELGRLDLNTVYALKPEWLNDGYGSLYKKGVGYKLSLKDAVAIMLKESDNTALRMIIEANDKVLKDEDRALGSLDIELDTQDDGSIEIGTRSYSSFLKCLYFACYNNKEDSQTILKLLTETPFDNRIVAGISDKAVPVAHKIGVYNTQLQGDCGIVYVPRKNYVLCVMIAGADDETTNSHFADVSRMTYAFVKK